MEITHGHEDVLGSSQESDAASGPIVIELSDSSKLGPRKKVPCRPKFSNLVVLSDSDVTLPEPSSAAGAHAVAVAAPPSIQTRRFQDSWATSFPWAEKVLDENGVAVLVRCLICTRVEGRITTIAMKKDNLNKHAGWKCATRAMPKQGVVAGEWYWDSNNKHFRNERAYAALGRETVLQKLQKAGDEPDCKKKEQFACVYWLLSNARPMKDFPSLRELLQHIGVKVPKKHWNIQSGWGMAEAIHFMYREKVKELLQAAHFISVTCDEVTSIDNGAWISVHVYVVINHVHVPLLLRLERVMGKAGSNLLTQMIMHGLLGAGGLTHEQLMVKLVCFGADGASTFQGCRHGVGVQIREKFAPHVLCVHCWAHKTHLAVTAISGVMVVARTEVLLQKTHEYFCKSPKRHLEFTKLAEIMETKGRKILKHVKTRWCSMLLPAQRILSEYRTLVVKMTLYEDKKSPAKALLDSLSDSETLLGLACIVPLMEIVNCLSKHAQARDAYVCDFVAAVRQCVIELHSMYIEESTAFKSDHFTVLKGLEETTSESIRLKWVPDLNSRNAEVEHLAFQSSDVSSNIFVVTKNFVTGEKTKVTRADWATTTKLVKEQCVGEFENPKLSNAITQFLCLIYVCMSLPFGSNFCIL